MWPLAQFGHAARHLGAFHGAYLAERPLPACAVAVPGLAADLGGPLRRRDGAPGGARDDAAVRRYWPGDVYERALRLWGSGRRSWRRSSGCRRRWGTATSSALTCSRAPGRAGRARPWPSTGRTSGSRPWASTWRTWWRGAASSSPPSRRPCPSSTARWRAHYADGLRSAGWRGDGRLVEFAQAATTGVLAGVHPWGATAHSEAQRAVDRARLGPAVRRGGRAERARPRLRPGPSGRGPARWAAPPDWSCL